MRCVSGLAGTGIDGPSISVNIMEFDRPDCLGDIANLGLTLAEGKQLLALVQQEVVAAQVSNHAVLRPACRACNGRCHVKDWRQHRYRGTVRKLGDRVGSDMTDRAVAG